MNRAQVSMDFLIVASVVMILFAAVFSVYTAKKESAAGAESMMSAQSICELAAWKMNSVLQAGNGSSTTLFLPETLSTGENYSLEVVGHRVEIVWPVSSPNQTYSSPVLGSVAGSLATGEEIKITNKEGVIVVS